MGNSSASGAIVPHDQPEILGIFCLEVDDSLTDDEFVAGVRFQTRHRECPGHVMASSSVNLRVLTLSCNACGEMGVIRYEKGGDSIG